MITEEQEVAEGKPVPSDEVESDPAERRLSKPGIWILGLYLFLLSLALVYTLFKAWPWTIELDNTKLFWGPFSLTVPADPDFRLLLIAALSGALGAFVHAATSFASFLGNRSLMRSWSGWYVFRPLIGMALALLAYFAVRGGFMTPMADAQVVSPYGVAAISGLVGLFSKQAADKLKDVFETVFNSEGDRARKDPLSKTSPQTPRKAGGGS